MSEYAATINWKRQDGELFTDKKYSRAHSLTFDEGLSVPASASPGSVPLPYSVAAAVDPEEGFVASISSCHMLWFLSIAAQRGFVVDSYHDPATGILERNGAGKIAMTRVTLRPEVVFSGTVTPSDDEFAAMHHEAHEECYIANSVTTEILCQPVLRSK
jgi:organic hydroperoxide reductase OsmC/OhrA